MDFGGTLFNPAQMLQRLSEIIHVKYDTQCPTHSHRKEGCKCGQQGRKMLEPTWGKWDDSGEVAFELSLQEG